MEAPTADKLISFGQTLANIEATFSEDRHARPNLVYAHCPTEHEHDGYSDNGNRSEHLRDQKQPGSNHEKHEDLLE